MSNAKTTADLFRERGWGVGTKVRHSAWLPERYAFVRFIGKTRVLVETNQGIECATEAGIQPHEQRFWSLYTPTPPVPTEDEWREWWAKLKAFRDACERYPREHGGEVADLLHSIDAIAAKENAA